MLPNVNDTGRMSAGVDNNLYRDKRRTDHGSENDVYQVGYIRFLHNNTGGRMNQKLLLCAGALLAVGMMQGCKSGNPAQPPSDTQRTVLFSDGFENGLTQWPNKYMITAGRFFDKCSIAATAAHQGTHSLTADSNKCALVSTIESGADSGIVGLEFYIRANVAGNINFSVQMGKNGGSSGGCTQKFGIGLNTDNKIVCIWTNMEGAYGETDKDTVLSAFSLNTWYKCAIEINYQSTPWLITYLLDDHIVATRICPSGLYGIDRILAIRETDGDSGLNPKPYFADDIVFYRK